MTIPTAQLSQLHRADGSATYSSGGYTVIGAVNGPIEVQRRDELPEEAAIEVNIRPAVGVGSKNVGKQNGKCQVLIRLCRSKGAPSGVHHTFHSPTCHPHSQPPSYSDSSDTSGRQHPNRRVTAAFFIRKSSTLHCHQYIT